MANPANPVPNIVLHPEFVGTTDSADFWGPIARPVSDDFRHFFTQIVTEYDGDPIPTVADYSRLGGSADLADFQGPISRSVSDDFRHFFTQIATEYDADPIPTVADYSRLGGTADSADFQGPIARLVSDDFCQFSLKSLPNIHSGQGIHLMRFYHLFSRDLISNQRATESYLPDFYGINCHQFMFRLSICSWQ